MASSRIHNTNERRANKIQEDVQSVYLIGEVKFSGGN